MAMFSLCGKPAGFVMYDYRSKSRTHNTVQVTRRTCTLTRGRYCNLRWKIPTRLFTDLCHGIWMNGILQRYWFWAIKSQYFRLSSLEWYGNVKLLMPPVAPVKEQQGIAATLNNTSTVVPSIFQLKVDDRFERAGFCMLTIWSHFSHCLRGLGPN